MKWTRQKPIEPGFYWVRYNSSGGTCRSDDAGGSGDICEMWFDDGEMIICLIGDDLLQPASDLTICEWSDEPIQKPA